MPDVGLPPSLKPLFPENDEAPVFCSGLLMWLRSDQRDIHYTVQYPVTLLPPVDPANRQERDVRGFQRAVWDDLQPQDAVVFPDPQRE